MRQWKLLIEDDAGKTIVVPLTRDVITIGRKEGNTIRLTERNVSRFHARLSREGDGLYVEDLESYNGIKLNGDRIKGRVEVSDGDLIEIGDYHLALQTEAKNLDTLREGKGPRRPLAAHEYEEVDDQFSGDTQRWEPPDAAGAMGGLTVPDQSPNFVPPGMGGGDFLAPGFENESTQNQFLDNLDETIPMPSAPFDDSGPGGNINNLAPSALTEPSGSPLGIGAEPAHFASMRANPLDEATEAVSRAPAPVADEHVDENRLVALNTVLAGLVYPLLSDEIIVGRVDCDLVLEHRSVSRSHAKLARDGDTFRIVDLKSSNGVLLNGDEVDEAPLRAGDVIELGRVQLRYVPAGERFSLSREDVERERLADLTPIGAGDEETGGLSAYGREQRGPNRTYVVAGALTVAALGLGAWYFLGGEKPPPPAPTNVSTPPTTTTSATDVKAPPDQPTAAKDPPPVDVTPPPVDPDPDPQPAAAVDSAAEERRALDLEKAGKIDAARKAWTKLQNDGNLKAGEALARLDEVEASRAKLDKVKDAFAKKQYRETIELAAEFDPAVPAAKEAEALAGKARRAGAKDAYKAGTTAIKKRQLKSALSALATLEYFSPDGKQTKDLKKRVKKLETQKAQATARGDSGGDDEVEESGPTDEDRARAKALVDEGVRRFATGDHTAAEAALLEARSLDPVRPETYRALGLVYKKTGEKEKAVLNFRKYLSLNRYAKDRSKIEVEIHELEQAKP